MLVTLVWVTGSPGAGKSTACELLQSRGVLAVDADCQGYNQWFDRASGQVVTAPPDPVPAGWLDRFAWKISRPQVETLAAAARGKTAFLCGSVENEVEAWDLFDLVICLVIDDQTLRHRLRDRTNNGFGKHPEELAAALKWNPGNEASYRRFGAVIIDGTRPPAEVTNAILAAAQTAGATLRASFLAQ